MPLPTIAHVTTEESLGHFVVLYKVNKDRVVVADPASGIQTLSRDAFCQRWTGFLLLLVPGQQGPPVAAGSAPPSPWRRFVGLLRAHTSILIEAFSCALLMTVLGVASSYFIQHLVDSVLVRHETRLLNALGIGMLLLLLFQTLFGLLREYLVAHVGRKVDLALIADYSRHVLGLPLQFFEMRRAGEILSRVSDAAKVREAISGTALTTVVDGTIVVLLTGLLWLYDVSLALVATLFVPVLILSVVVHHPAAQRRSRAAMNNGAELSAHLVEDVIGIETIKGSGAEDIRAEQGEGRLVRLVQSLFALETLGLSINAIGTFVTALAGLVVLWYGGHRVMSGALTIGQLMCFHSLLGYLLGPLERLASVNLKLQDALIAVDRLYQILDLPQEVLADHHKATLPGVPHTIELKDVSFGYEGRAKVLEHVNLCIPAGTTVAIVGETGSGKSSLLKLLMGFYLPTDGRILLDGVDMRDLTLASLRSRIGLVSQEPHIFNGTLHENIGFGQPEARLEEIMEAAQVAGLGEFITSLPKRYDTVIGERGATSLEGSANGWRSPGRFCGSPSS